MSIHAHIALCNEDMVFLYDNVSFSPKDSVRNFLDVIFDTYSPKTISRNAVEADMYRRVDEKNGNPIYFKSGDFFFVWAQCDKCRLSSLN